MVKVAQFARAGLRLGVAAPVGPEEIFMAKSNPIFLTALLLGVNVLADVGYIYKADLNSDGIIDSIMSGPSDLFGNGGGPFLVSLSTPKGKPIQKIVGLHPMATALENNGSISRTGSYWYMSAGGDSLDVTTLDSTFKSEAVTLNFASDGLSQNVYDAVFNENHFLRFRKVENYTPPAWEWGK